MSALALWLVVALARGQGNLVFESPDHDLRVLDSPDCRVGQDLHGNIRFSGSGNPITVEVRSNGLTVSGLKLTGRAAPGPNKTYIVQEVHDVGSAKLVIDSAQSDQFKSSQAKAEGKPFELNKNVNKTTVTSEVFDYTGGADTGTLTLSQPFHIAGVGNGERMVDKTVDNKKTQVRQVFDQTLDLDAMTGVVEIDPRPAKRGSQIKSGTIKGKVMFHLIRHEKNDGDQEPTLYDIVGTCDEMDFAVEGVNEIITAKGHVKVTGTVGTHLADKVVITLDPDFQPIYIESTGSPSESRLPVEVTQP
jgi:hypothetical protein